MYIVHMPCDSLGYLSPDRNILPILQGLRNAPSPNSLPSMLLKQTEVINHHMIGIATKIQRPLKTTHESQICVGSLFRSTTQIFLMKENVCCSFTFKIPESVFLRIIGVTEHLELFHSKPQMFSVAVWQ